MTADSTPLRPRVELNVDGIPAELKPLPRWVAYRMTPPKKEGGKPGKVPVDPRTGGNASSTDPKSWGTFDEALAAMKRYDLAGIGFMFEGSGYVGIDLDGCCDPESGEMTDAAKAIVERFDTFTEYSPTATGLHLFLKGTLPGKGKHKGWIEVYNAGRFFTMTGVSVVGTPTGCANSQPAIDDFYEELCTKGKTREERRAEVAQEVDEEQVIEKAIRAKNGAKFLRLWTGDLSGYASASEADSALCCLLAFWTRKNAQMIDSLFRRSPLMRDKWDERHGAQTYGQMTIDSAIEKTSQVYDPQNAPAYRVDHTEAGDGRPYIVLNGALSPELHVAAQRVLAAAKPPVIFQRDRMLVRVARVPDFNADGIERKGDAVFITPLDAPMLELVLTEAADWIRIVKGEAVKVDCPSKVAVTLLSAHGSWKLPALLGVVEAPTLRPDGSCLDRPGYDPATTLYAEFSGMEFPPLLDRPTRENALAALEYILSFISRFPFVAESDRATIVAVILTALIRRMLRTAPLFALRATTMSAGKTLLADVVSIIATGRSCAVMTQGKDETEDQKRMLSLLIGGDLVVNIDNVERPLGGADLCAVLTEEMYQSRLLGASKMVKVPTRTLFIATGNNLVIEGDLISRVGVCDLDPKVERAEQREFEGNLREEILKNRAMLVRAGLTILRAYRVAGRPKVKISAFGRFEQWSMDVRASLVWLGMDDPLLGVERLRDQDPVQSRLRAILHTWWEALRDQPTSVGELMRTAKGGADGLREAIEEAVGTQHGSVSAQSLGIYLRKFANRIVDGMRLVRHDQLRGVARWRVEEVSGGTCGTSQAGVQKDKNQEAEGYAGQFSGFGEAAWEVPQVPPNGTSATPQPCAHASERGFSSNVAGELDPLCSSPPPLPVTSLAEGSDANQGQRGGASDRRCRLCNRTRFWRRSNGTEVVCGTCYPPTIPTDHVEWLDDDAGFVSGSRPGTGVEGCISDSDAISATSGTPPRSTRSGADEDRSALECAQGDEGAANG